MLLCYNYQYEINKCTNSHKILEYLSTGKVIISSKIQAYESNSNLICMLQDYDNGAYLDLFDLTIKNIVHYNSTELQKKRIEFSLDNSYEKQINRIESYINKTL